MSETADYTDVKLLCQDGNTDYRIHLIKYQIPNPAPAINASKTKLKSTMTSLNLRYRFLSAGANELCGKYGGGVYVAIALTLRSWRGHGQPRLFQLLYLLFLQ